MKHTRNYEGLQSHRFDVGAWGLEFGVQSLGLGFTIQGLGSGVFVCPGGATKDASM